METPRRTLLKALVWQGLGLLSMTLVGWIVIGSAQLAGGLAVLNMGIGFCAYVLHERLWARVRWGRTGGAA
jgi:uncharacterized membrane protein